VSHRAASLLAVGLAVVIAGAVASGEAQSDERFKPPRNEETFQAIVKAARESNRDVRDKVAWVLGQTGRADALPVLEGLLRDPAPEVQASALRAICELAPAGSEVPFSPDVPISDRFLRLVALEAAGHLRFPARQALIENAVASDEARERALAARALRLDDPASARALLVRLLEDRHALVRAAAVETLGAARDEQALASVISAMGDRSEPDSFVVRAAACCAMAEMRPQRGLDLIHRAVSEEHYFVRRSAIEAIVALDDHTGVEVIQRQIEDPDYTVRVACCVALGKLVEPTSPPYLAARLADEVPEVRQAADDALVTFPSDLAYSALLEWVDYTGLQETRRRVWRILGEYGHPGTRETAWTHVQVESEDIPVRVAALKILRKLADRRIIPIVTAILQTPPATMNRNPPPEGMVEESFRAATEFGLREGIGLGKFVLVRAQITMPDDGYMPAPDTVAAVFEYFASLKYVEAVPAMERVFEMLKNLRDPVVLALKKALEDLTGRTYELPPPPEKAATYGAYFIDVRPETPEPPTSGQTNPPAAPRGPMKVGRGPSAPQCGSLVRETQ